MTIKITLPDKSIKEFKKGITGLEVASSISEGLAKQALAVKINGVLCDLIQIIEKDSKIEIITSKSIESLQVLRHTTAHVFAQGLLRVHKNALITIGPAIENGFFYDVDCDELTDDSLLKIEDEMKKIIKENLSIKVEYKTKEEALKFFKNNVYKKEIIDAISSKKLSEEELGEGKIENGKFKFYTQGEFTDLCTGPHLPNTGLIKAFKLEKVTKAYWRANSENKQLNRVYGLVFWKTTELEDYVKLVEEAKKRDHRILGKQMNLFMNHEYAPGMTFFLPKGFVMYRELQTFIREQYVKQDYKEVMTPNMFNKKLWEISGHWEHYKDDIFRLKVDETEFALKPMNCPSHCLIFKNDFKSYKDLPLRIADFGALHRNELSGALSGLTRVRKFCQDDAHIFCRMEQIETEIDNLIKLVDYVYRDTFKMTYDIELSTRPEKSLGTDEMWKIAENSLQKGITRNGKEYKICPGDGAFYGPKIDFRIKDCLGRIHQTATIQLDFNLPLRFELKFESEKGTAEQPVMIHRAILGSVERFMAIMIEHFAGKFPLWLSPVQVMIINVADRHVDYCNEIKNKLFENGFRVVTNYDSMTVQNKIRLARENDKPNYMLILGDEDIKNNTVSVRTRKFENGKNEEFTTNIDEFIINIIKERNNREIKY